MNADPSINPSRLKGLDLARGAAIAGMILVHFNQLIGTLPYTGPRWLTWIGTLIEGRSAATFMILAGVGMSLMGRRARISGNSGDRKSVRTILLKRSLVLFITGLLFHFAWGSDILHYYGVFVAIGCFFLFAPGTWLWTGALFLNVGFVIMLLVFNSSDTWCYDAGWNWETLEYVGFWTPVGFLRNLLINGWFPLFPWMGFLLVGIWLGRQDLRNRRIRLYCMAGGGLVAFTTSAVSWVMATHIGPDRLGLPLELSMALFGEDPLPPAPFFILQSGATAFVVIAICIEFAERFANARWIQPLFVFGQYSLSIYIGHILLMISPLCGLGWVGQNICITFPAGFAAIGISLVFCMVWNKRFGRGPLEIVIRRLSHPHPE